MAAPQSRYGRRFLQSAHQRFADAVFLLEGSRTTGAVYLAGYSVECVLKALILSITPAKRKSDVVDSFRGSRAHDFEWLKYQYLEKGGAIFPPQVAKHFSKVSSWTTDLRYMPGATKRSEADRFLAATREIVDWAEGRL